MFCFIVLLFHFIELIIAINRNIFAFYALSFRYINILFRLHEILLRFIEWIIAISRKKYHCVILNYISFYRINSSDISKYFLRFITLSFQYIKILFRFIEILLRFIESIIAFSKHHCVLSNYVSFFFN